MQKKVLLIDDDEATLDAMQEALSYEGFKVNALFNTPDILALVNDFKPDIILIDYILDGVNGGELCHQVKANYKTCNLPVIIISAYPRVLKSLGYYGCNAFVPKPFDLFDLIDQINTLTCKPAFYKDYL